MSVEISSRPLRLILAITILVAVGPIAAFGIFLQLFACLVIECIFICNNIQAAQKRRWLEREHNRRQAEISIITSRIAQNLDQLTASDIAKRQAAEDDLRKKHRESVAEESVAAVSSLVVQYVLADENAAPGQLLTNLGGELEKSLKSSMNDTRDLVRAAKKKAAEAERRTLETEERQSSAEQRAIAAETRLLNAERKARRAEKRLSNAEQRALETEIRQSNAERKALEAEKRTSDAERSAREAQDRASTAVQRYNSNLELSRLEGRRRELQPHRLPKSLEGIDPSAGGFTCIGTTKKRARCTQNYLNNSDKRDAAERLQKMQSEDPGDSYEYGRLLQLANWMLCPRWHLDKLPQGPEIASKWYKELKPVRESLEALGRTRTSPNGVGNLMEHASIDWTHQLSPSVRLFGDGNSFSTLHRGHSSSSFGGSSCTSYSSNDFACS